MRYRIGSKLDEEDNVVQVSSLINAMGTDAETVYVTLHIVTQATFDDMLAKFDEFLFQKQTSYTSVLYSMPDVTRVVKA